MSMEKVRHKRVLGKTIKSMRSNDAYMHQYSRPSLFIIMDCCLFSAIIYISTKRNSTKLSSKYDNFHSKKFIWKYHLKTGTIWSWPQCVNMSNIILYSCSLWPFPVHIGSSGHCRSYDALKYTNRAPLWCRHKHRLAHMALWGEQIRILSYIYIQCQYLLAWRKKEVRSDSHQPAHMKCCWKWFFFYFKLH